MYLLKKYKAKAGTLKHFYYNFIITSKLWKYGCKYKTGHDSWLFTLRGKIGRGCFRTIGGVGSGIVVPSTIAELDLHVSPSQPISNHDKCH